MPFTLDENQSIYLGMIAEALLKQPVVAAVYVAPRLREGYGYIIIAVVPDFTQLDFDPDLITEPTGPIGARHHGLKFLGFPSVRAITRTMAPNAVVTLYTSVICVAPDPATAGMMHSIAPENRLVYEPQTKRFIAA